MAHDLTRSAVSGEGEIEERSLDHLDGYAGERPVRVGNGAYNQRRHDVWGAVRDSVWLPTRSRDHLDDRVGQILKRQVDHAIKHRGETDHRVEETDDGRSGDAHQAFAAGEPTAASTDKRRSAGTGR